MHPDGDRRDQNISEEIAAAELTNQHVKIWDLGLRLFHWLLVIVVISLLISGFFFHKPFLIYHNILGYGLICLLIFRMVWGVVGSEFSRFGSFLFSIKDSIGYVRALLHARQPHYLGHNPLAALMVFALLAMLAALAVSGVLALGGGEFEGPLGRLTTQSAGEAATALHARLAWGLIGLVTLHLFGVSVSACRGEPRLIRSMIDGIKPAPPGPHLPSVRAGQPKQAVMALFGIAGGILLFLLWTKELPSWPAPPPLDPLYRRECGACHCAYYPSLLPAASWQRMMAELGDHFGEDARLDQTQAEKIEAWLSVLGADTIATPAARRLPSTDPYRPLRITAGPSWRQRHRHVEAALFKKVKGGAGNCPACHGDADSGLFSYRKIQPAK